jgi:3-phosphoshikimate 1-carboxyvinyltransferase
MVSNLKLLGADVEETDDGIIIHGRGCGLHGNFINSFNDHRIVMAMTVAGAALDDGAVIDDISSVGISFPEFFKTIEGLSS